MENHETTEQAAIRETWEEAQAQVTALKLYSVFSIPHISQIYLMFLARLVPNDPLFAAGSESLEVALFDETDIPWSELAFPVVQKTLMQYYQDRLQGQFPIRVGDINKSIPTLKKHVSP
jgi:ADP-ribose pyrophosphatase YjhB (NUDIX family)